MIERNYEYLREQKNSCAWCNRELDHSFQKYIVSGNCCEKCSVKFAENARYRINNTQV